MKNQKSLSYFADIKTLAVKITSENSEEVNRLLPATLNTETATQQEKSKVCIPIVGVLESSNGYIRKTPLYLNTCYSKEKISFLKMLDKVVSECAHAEMRKADIWVYDISKFYSVIKWELFANNFTQVIDPDSAKVIYTGEYPIKKEHANNFIIRGKSLNKFSGIIINYKYFQITINAIESLVSITPRELIKWQGMTELLYYNMANLTLYNLKSEIEKVKNHAVERLNLLSLSIQAYREYVKINYGAVGRTIGGLAFSSIKKFLEKSGERIEDLYPYLDSTKPEHIINNMAYLGGILYLNPKFKHILFYPVNGIDINSSFGASMLYPLPYGNGKLIKDKKEMSEGFSVYFGYIQYSMPEIPFYNNNINNVLKIYKKIKKNKINTKGRKNVIIDGVIYDELTPLYFERLSPETKIKYFQNYAGYIFINSIDLELIRKYADLQIFEVEGGYNYQTSTHLKPYIETIYPDKNSKNKVISKCAKNFIVNSYGKFAQNLSGKVTLYENPYNYDDRQATNTIVAEDLQAHYLPVASAITAHARARLLQAAEVIGFENIIYMDSDSIYFQHNQEIINALTQAALLHPSDLGKFKYICPINDGVMESAIFFDFKKYALNYGNRTYLKVSGMPVRHKHYNFSDLIESKTRIDVQNTREIYGGYEYVWEKYNIMKG